MLSTIWPEMRARYSNFSAYFARTVARRWPETAAEVEDLNALATETAHEGERDDDMYGDYND